MVWRFYSRPLENVYRLAQELGIWSEDADRETGEREAMSDMFDCLTGEPIIGPCNVGEDIQCNLLEGQLFQLPPGDEANSFASLTHIMNEVNSVFNRLWEAEMKKLEKYPNLRGIEMTVVPTPRGMQLVWCKPPADPASGRPLKKLKVRLMPSNRWWPRMRRERRLRRIKSDLRECLAKRRAPTVPAVPKPGMAPKRLAATEPMPPKK